MKTITAQKNDVFHLAFLQISSKDTHSFFWTLSKNQPLLSFSLIFCQFEPGVAYKSLAYKKACIQ